MKKIVIILAIFLGIATSATAQEVKTIALEQTKGAFTEQQMTVNEGTYIFKITNTNVGHDVGFVLAPKGKTDAAHHIKAAYVTQPVANNTTGTSKEVTLKKGTYVYFCPLNPTPEYTLIVK